MFLTLEKYLLLNFIQVWIDVEDIGKLDTAMTNHTSRDIFLQFISVDFIKSVHGSKSNIISQSCFNWMFMRKVPIDYVIFSNGTIYVPNIQLDLLKSITFNSCWKENAQSLTNILKNAKSLTELHASESKHFTGARIKFNCPQLTSCNFYRMTALTDKCIIALVNTCKFITQISLSRCETISDAAVNALTENCKQLTFLNIANNNQLTDVSLTSIATHCPTLTALNADYCKLTVASVINMIKSCPALTELHLCNVVEKGPVESVVQCVAAHLPSIKLLDIGSTKAMAVDFLTLLCSSCSQLTDMKVNAGVQLSLQQYHESIGKLKNLRRIVLFTLTNKYFDSVIGEHSGITKVNFAQKILEFTPQKSSSSGETTTKGPKRIATALASLKALAPTDGNVEDLVEHEQYQRLLVRSYATLTDFCGAMFNVDKMCIVLAQCRRLTTLNLTALNDLNDSHLLALSDGCQYLTELNLSRSSRFTDSGIVPLLQVNPDLRVLDCHNCWQLTDLTVDAITESCLKIVWLDISYVQINDASLHNIASKLRKIGSLRIEGCRATTSDAIRNLVTSCVHLHTLKFDQTAASAEFDKDFKAKYLMFPFSFVPSGLPGNQS